MSEKDLAKEFYEHRDDPEEWGEEAEEIEVRPSGSHVFSFRLTSQELDDLEMATKRTGESTSEYIRKSLKVRHRLGL